MTQIEGKDPGLKALESGGACFMVPVMWVLVPSAPPRAPDGDSAVWNSSAVRKHLYLGWGGKQTIGEFHQRKADSLFFFFSIHFYLTKKNPSGFPVCENRWKGARLGPERWQFRRSQILGWNWRWSHQCLLMNVLCELSLRISQEDEDLALSPYLFPFPFSQYCNVTLWLSSIHCSHDTYLNTVIDEIWTVLFIIFGHKG